MELELPSGVLLSLTWPLTNPSCSTARAGLAPYFEGRTLDLPVDADLKEQIKWESKQTLASFGADTLALYKDNIGISKM